MGYKIMFSSEILNKFERTGDAAAFVAELSFEEKIVVFAILRALNGAGKDLLCEKV